MKGTKKSVLHLLVEMHATQKNFAGVKIGILSRIISIPVHKKAKKKILSPKSLFYK